MGFSIDWPEIDEHSFVSVSAALRSRRWSLSSPVRPLAHWTVPDRIGLAEAALESFFGRKHAITCCNGSAAIVISLQALGIGPGSRVLLPALTWVGCASAVLRCGASPVFADSLASSPVMDSAAAAQKCGRIDAVLAVHTYASALDIDVVRQHFPGIPIIEDFSHSHGGRRDDGLLLGCQGDISVASFQASKVLTCGEGGAAFTDDDALAERLRALRADSRLPVKDKSTGCFGGLAPHGSQHGYNLTMSEIAAALLLNQLQLLPDQLVRRATGAAAFLEAAASLGVESVGDAAVIASGGFYRLPVRHPDHDGAGMADLVRRTLNLQLDRSYPPIPVSPLYRPQSIPVFRHAVAEDQNDVFPQAERWSRSLCPLQHEYFLAPVPTLIRLAHGLTGRVSPPVAPVTVAGGEAEAITVVTITRGDRPSLARAIASAAGQEIAAKLTLLLIVDGPHCLDLPPPSGAIASLRQLSVHGPVLSAVDNSLVHLARLRNLAVSLVETPFVTFLDDDNRWMSDHLSSLLDALACSGADAAYSWRYLEDADGKPWSASHFPWLPPGKARDARWQELLAEGVVVPGEPVVRDRMVLSDGRVGMVDTGAWLFRTAMLHSLPFVTSYSDEDLRTMNSEDDKLLAQMIRNNISGFCTERATFFYRLGGCSNGKMNNLV